MIDSVQQAIANVKHPAFFRDERAFQGELLVGLARFGLIPAGAVVQQEAQKTLRNHGLQLRPDIIIHRPAGDGQDRRENNHAVIALKREAMERGATQDFASLDEMIRLLDYRFAVFINVGSTNTFGDAYRGNYRDRFTFFASALNDGQVSVVREWFEGNDLKSRVDRYA